MAVYNFKSLKEKYGYFDEPKVVVKVNDKDLTSSKGFPVGEVMIELTSGYEASIAEFSIFDAYDLAQNEFLFEAVKKFILLGSKVEIEMGYRKATKTVFIGVITRVNFLYEKAGIPCIRVTSMDVKGVMMAGSYNRQLTAVNYSDAVEEILKRTAYDKLRDSGIITKTSIEATPDKKNAQGGSNETTDKTIEMVAESDYEFVVKAGKRNNYEFFTECGNVIFRQAKPEKEKSNLLIEIDPTMNLQSFDISYDITGITEKVIVRGMDVAKAKVISAEKKLSNAISQGNKAKAVVKGSQKVYIDSTVSSKEDAEVRAKSLAADMAYRYGTLNCEIIGLPELQPGHFIRIFGLGTGPDNVFYIRRVLHELNADGRYFAVIEGVSDSAGTEDALGSALGGMSLPF